MGRKQASAGRALRFLFFPFRDQAGQIDLALFRHLDQRLGRTRVVDVFRQPTTALDPRAHIFRGSSLMRRQQSLPCRVPTRSVFVRASGNDATAFRMRRSADV